jgi:hypothetical protein
MRRERNCVHVRNRKSRRKAGFILTCGRATSAVSEGSVFRKSLGIECSELMSQEAAEASKRVSHPASLIDRK